MSVGVAKSKEVSIKRNLPPVPFLFDVNDCLWLAINKNAITYDVIRLDTGKTWVTPVKPEWVLNPGEEVILRQND